MAYRTAEQERWKSFDFVVGYEVKITQNGKHVPDICDDLAGKYPKSFIFRCWHPMCLCYTIPILKTEDEFFGDDDTESVNAVKDVPQGFKDWVNDNEDRINAAEKRGTLPYFIRDNKEKVTWILKGESAATKNNVPSVQPKPSPAKEPSPLEKNHQELAKALGIKQGEPMTVEEANELRGNPHYSESVGYRVNCQSAVVANEMRRRGFDVEALPNIKGSLSEKLSENTAAAWVDAAGETPRKSRAGGWYFKPGSVKEFHKTPRQMMTEFEDLTSEPGRYHIDWKWKGRTNDGHIITFERLADGSGFYYDPQSGKRFDKFPWTAKVAPKFGIKVLRIDNLRLNVDMAKGVVTSKGSAIIKGNASKNGVEGMGKQHSKDRIREIQQRWNERKNGSIRISGA